jgi:toxin ParE1/3/4
VTPYTVVFAPEAEDNLVELYEYISEHGSPALAQRYTDAIVTHCESLATFPLRGTRRDDVRPNLRITNYRRRTVIAFEVDEAGRRVAILGIFYGGRDYESAFGAAIDWQSSPDDR